MHNLEACLKTCPQSKPTKKMFRYLAAALLVATAVGKKSSLTSTGTVPHGVKMQPSKAKCTLANANGDRMLTCGTKTTKINLISQNNKPVTSGADDQVTTYLANQFLCPNTFVYPGWGMTSKNGVHTMVYQEDGDLCVYSPVWTWCAVTNVADIMDASGAGYALLSLDGNFILKSYDHTPYWSTGTDGDYPSYLIMQNDGNLCINSGDDGSFIWCANGDGGMYDDDAAGRPYLGEGVDDDLGGFDDEVTSQCASDWAYAGEADDDAPLYSFFTGKLSWSAYAGAVCFAACAVVACYAAYVHGKRQGSGYETVTSDAGYRSNIQL